MKQITGIHHITAITTDPQLNIDFYTGVLGLRLVKLTVNFDDPGSYHLYYGDRIGSPGSIITFFAWPGARNGLHGTGQVTGVAFSIPEQSLHYWVERLDEHGVEHDEPFHRFNEWVLMFSDPDGLALEIVAAPGPAANHWNKSPVPPEHSIRGFHSATLSEEGYERTAKLLTTTMGFKLIDHSGSRFRYEIGESGIGNLIDVLCLPDIQPGVVSAGTVHHIAYRTPDDSQQQAWRRDIADLGYNITPVIDRQYFRSIYYREPGGILFEIATDPPGFSLDEPEEELGTRLMLPVWLEPLRGRLEKALPPVSVPQAV